MKKKDVKQYYDKLTEDERIDLIIRAGKREDREEIKNLLESNTNNNCSFTKEALTELKEWFSTLSTEELSALANL